MNKQISIAGIVMILAFFMGCSIEKRTARKDDLAVERVTAKKSLLNRIKAPVDSLWPCVIDTVTVRLPGRIDSVRISVYVPAYIDTTNRKRIVDSLNSSAGECREKLYQAYSNGFDAATDLYKNVKILIKQPDTLSNIVVNKRELQIANEARIAADIRTSAADALAKSYKNDRTTFLWLFIAALVAFILSNAAWLYFKFKK